MLCSVPWLGGMKTVSRNRWSYKLVPAYLGQANWLQSLKGCLWSWLWADPCCKLSGQTVPLTLLCGCPSLPDVLSVQAFQDYTTARYSSQPFYSGRAGSYTQPSTEQQLGSPNWMKIDEDPVLETAFCLGTRVRQTCTPPASLVRRWVVLALQVSRAAGWTLGHYKHEFVLP